jgi:hypothetical protein
MTCGFIVVCVPCVPKILMESGVWRRMKKTFGMNVSSGGTPGNTIGQSGASALRSKNMRSVNKSYLEIDDTELATMGSESTEHLRDPYVNVEKGIVRTTEVKVTQNLDNTNSNETMYENRTQWR